MVANHFDTISYLRSGSAIQQKAYRALSGCRLLEQLCDYTPILAGTIPIDIAVAGSDLDILCCYTDAQTFIADIEDLFSQMPDFRIHDQSDDDPAAIVTGFRLGDFETEIFAHTIPVRQQYGYRHMQIEHALLNLYGESLRQQVITLKEQGIKTEPAFCIALGLSGNPYQTLLQFETGFTT